MASQACLVCFQPAFGSLDNKLLTSIKCEHQVCRRCLQKQRFSANITAEAADALSSVCATQKSLKSKVKCPVCQMLSNLEDWTDREAEESQLEQETLVRQKVIAILNSTRDNFDTTPLYNNFLENRESTIYNLAYSNDENLKKQLQEELENYEIEFQKQIVECKQKAINDSQEEIRNIVQKEGIFYEIVQQNVGPGFRYTGNSKLIHCLERAYPELFLTQETASGNISKSQGSLGEGVIGIGNHPKPLQPNLNYLTLPKRPPTDKAALLRASGLFKDLIAQRVLLELWESLKLTLPTN